MGSALERLLARPSASELLRHLLAHDLCCISSSTPRFQGRQLPYQVLQTRRKISNSSQARRLDGPQVLDRSRLVHGTSQDDSKTFFRRATFGKRDDYISLLAPTDHFTEEAHGQRYLLNRLSYEADVNGAPTSGVRLVDKAEHRDDLQLWLELVRFRSRIEGVLGVKDIWRGMRQRTIHLPVQGEISDALWMSFLSAGFEQPQFLHVICDYAKELYKTSALQYPHLYQHIVGHWLRERPALAMLWHRRMKADGFVPSTASSSVVSDAMHSKDAFTAYKVFKVIYVQGNERRLYDQCMPAVLESSGFPTALKWHKFLVKYSDLPGLATRSKPGVRRLFAVAQLDAVKVSVKDDSRSTKGDMRVALEEVPLFSRESMNKIVGDVYGIKQKSMSDAFCARLFATGAFSIDMLIGGLKMFGLQSVGPLALRELAARSGSTQDFNAALDSLKSAGIPIAHTVFSQALQKLAINHEHEYFDILIKSDQHPDTYGDSSLQRKLFQSFLSDGKLAEARTTLAVLTTLDEDPEHSSWNLLLQTYCVRLHHAHVVHIVNDMLSHEIAVSNRSLDHIHQNLLRPRSRGRKPASRPRDREWPIDDLALVTDIFKSILVSGQAIHPTRWREILKRYGMTNRLFALESLSLWLVKQYASSDRHPAGTGLSLTPNSQEAIHSAPSYLSDLPISHPLHPYRQIFRIGLQRAIIAWGFGAAVLPATFISAKRRSKENYNWARGLGLLCTLQRGGVPINMPAAREEVLLRLMLIHNPGRSAVPANRLAHLSTLQPLGHRITYLRRIWKGFLKHLDHSLLDGSPPAEAQLRTVLFRNRKKTIRRRAGTKDLRLLQKSPASVGLKPNVVPREPDALAKQGMLSQTPFA